MIVGIIGGGQLAMMMALAGIPLGMRFIFLGPAEDACAAPLGEHLCGDYDDEALLNILAGKADVVTYEFENVPATAVATLAKNIDNFPLGAGPGHCTRPPERKNLVQGTGHTHNPFCHHRLIR